MMLLIPLSRSRTALCAAALFSATSLGAQHPVVPGVERLRRDPQSTPAERGAVLLSELSCVSCHQGQHGLPARRGPDLRAIGKRVNPNWLRRFLDDPQKTKPGTLMPRALAAVPAERRAQDLDALVQFLVAERQGPMPPATIDARSEMMRTGKKLFGELGCVACHAPVDGRDTEVQSVPLGPLAEKLTVDALTAFLKDPRKLRPASRMPHLWLQDREAQALAMYLLRDQVDNPQADEVLAPRRQGWAYEYFEVETNEVPDFDLLKVKKRGFCDDVRLPPGRRKRDFAVRLRGEIQVPEDGAYVFELEADDGGEVWIDGFLTVVDDRSEGRSRCTGEAELTKGRHRIEVRYYQQKKGESLRLFWSGPGSRRRPVRVGDVSHRFGRAMVPLGSPSEAERQRRPDAATLRRGREVYRSAGCASCHEPAQARNAAPALAELAGDGGCLSAQPAGGAVSFGLSATQTAEVRAALKARGFEKPLTGERAVRHGMAAFNCYACHQRGGVGGPEDARENLFATRVSIDLGDEGRVPPPLDHVGEKLRPGALRGIVLEGKHHIRGRFMATRMPGFAPEAVQPLLDGFLSADRKAAPAAVAAGGGKVDKAAVAAGRHIVGVTGFACVTCHYVNGDRSAGIPGIDLATAQERLNPDWFRRFLRKPSAFRKDTRMPGYWPEGSESPLTELLGGSSDRQIDAVWTYLSLGKSIPAPKGVQRPDDGPRAELRPEARPIVHRTFMDGVGGRAILAGFPDKLHVAFDAHAVRMAKVWRGRFFDASGVASGRSGRFLKPLGTEVLDLPGPAFARLAQGDTPWPSIEGNARDVGGVFRGIKLDKSGAPTFRYELAGVRIEERPLPEQRKGGASLRRLFSLSGERPPLDLHFRAWRARQIDAVGPGVWRAGDVTIRLKVDSRDPVRVREVGGEQELVVLLVFRKGGIRFEEVIQW